MAASGHRQPVTSAELREAIKVTPYVRTKDSAPARLNTANTDSGPQMGIGGLFHEGPGRDDNHLH